MPGLGQGQPFGQGGIQRGPGAAPMFYGDKQDLGTSNIEQVTNPDLERAAPGEVLGLGETEHEIDEEGFQRQSSGDIKNKGRGGDAVWRESLMPTEKKLLKRYFQ